MAPNIEPPIGGTPEESPVIELTKEVRAADVAPGATVNVMADDEELRLVVDEVSHRLDGVSIAARPPHRSDGRRIVVRCKSDESVVVIASEEQEAEALVSLMEHLPAEMVQRHADRSLCGVVFDGGWTLHLPPVK